MGGSTREPQYQVQFDSLRTHGPVVLGPTASHIWRSDPRHLGFLLARYKFCAKMLTGSGAVLEVGCGDGFGSRVVLQEVDSIHGVDFDPLFIQTARELAASEALNCTFEALDVCEARPTGMFDAAYALDVIEHVSAEKEDAFMSNLCSALVEGGVCILGTPNANSQVHASEWSRAGHVNLKDESGLRTLLSRHFQSVFVFSMNDEVVHVGYYPMAHYLLGMGVGTRRSLG